jgi:hypothetical protein
MAHIAHLPEPFRHAGAWYWFAAAFVVAVLVASWLVAYGLPAPIEPASYDGLVSWDFAA